MCDRSHSNIFICALLRDDFDSVSPTLYVFFFANQQVIKVEGKFLPSLGLSTLPLPKNACTYILRESIYECSIIERGLICERETLKVQVLDILRGEKRLQGNFREEITKQLHSMRFIRNKFTRLAFEHHLPNLWCSLHY